MIRAEVIFSERLNQRRRDFDRRFAWLAFAQWIAALLVAARYSPYTWQGSVATIHVHVWIAVTFGALLALPVFVLAKYRPGAAVTRHSVAVAQMMWGALFVHLTGGRIETHFHVFCSLAALAFYLDNRVLMSAAATVTIEHLIRGALWPTSVYGIANPEWWRFIEHGFWVVFEVLVLELGVHQTLRERRGHAADQADLEALNASFERTVEERTRDLAASRELYRSLVESTGTVPFSLDMQSRMLTYVGPQAERLLGVPAAEWLAPAFLRERLHPDDRAMLVELVNTAAGDNFERIVRVRHERGAWLSFRITAARATPAHVFHGFIFDVSDQRRLEQELQRAQKLESVGRLAAGVAHEINTPVQFVSDSLHFLREALVDLIPLVDAYDELAGRVLEDASSKDDALRVRQQAEQIDLPHLREQATRAVQLSLDGVARVALIVRSLKDFSRPNAFHEAAVDLNHNVQSTLVVARNEYKYVADLETSFADLPLVVCNAGEINQVVLNLVENAAHAISDKVAGTSERGNIRVSTARDGDDVVISVADSGLGIPAEHREHIFEPFFTTKEVGKGSGQGLATARAVVSKHRGALTFETETGAGTVFHVRLPIAGKDSQTSAVQHAPGG